MAAKRHVRSEKSALTQCLRLWSWLAETGEKHKSDWPGWEQWYAIMECFACDWSEQTGVMPGRMSICSETCILRELWPEGCCRGKSPYFLWTESTKKDRKRHAQRIADFCRKRLEKMK